MLTLFPLPRAIPQDNLIKPNIRFDQVYLLFNQTLPNLTLGLVSFTHSPHGRKQPTVETGFLRYRIRRRQLLAHYFLFLAHHLLYKIHLKSRAKVANFSYNRLQKNS